MTTIHPVHVYLDASGNVTEWIISDDDGFRPSERPGMVRVPVARKDYDALPSPLNVGGVAACHDLAKLCLPVLATIDSKLAAVCQANCDALDAKIAADTQKASADQVNAIAAWNALPQKVRDDAIAADLAGIPYTVPVIVGL